MEDGHVYVTWNFVINFRVVSRVQLGSDHLSSSSYPSDLNNKREHEAKACNAYRRYKKYVSAGASSVKRF